MDDAEKRGIIRPTADARVRAATLVLWDLVMIVLAEHMERALGETDQHEVLLRYSRFALEIYTHGMLITPDDRRTT